MKKININDTLYPEKLKKISNPPFSLYVEGNVNLFNSKSIAIIGTRYASENGKKLAEKFASELSQIGITIVSGLALGIDTVAHSFSHNQKGKTIAVLGSGFNKVFPEENTDLYQKILDNDGLIVSEYPPDTEAKSEYFAERNRIINGLSLGVLIIEAQYRSGTSITAKLAKKQNQPVFTLPHEIWDSNGIGTNKLLKNGAHLVTDTLDILNVLKLPNFRRCYLEMKNNGIFEKYSRFAIKKSYEIIRLQNSDSIESNTTISHINPVSKNISFTDHKQAIIYNIISTNSLKSQSIIPLSVNEIAHKTGLSVNEVLSTLFILEVNGHVKKVSGGYITCT